MIYLPPLRRFLLPALFFVTVIILYRGLPLSRKLPSFVIFSPSAAEQGTRIPIKISRTSLPITDRSSDHLSPPNHYFYKYDRPFFASNDNASETLQPHLDTDLAPLFQCSASPNKYTGHIRLPNIIQNVSMVPVGSTKPDPRVFWNPTIIALPHWSENQYLVVQRIVTSGTHQENVICEANICYTGPAENATRGEKPCTKEDLDLLGPAGGMRCATPPASLDVPPTPADYCTGKHSVYMDIPGFHDPRIFWSGKGEPLMMVNTQ